MHPRIGAPRLGRGDAAARRRRCSPSSASAGRVHPREVEAHFAHGSVTNYWGGSTNATTHLLDGMHYRGLLRVARRDERHPRLRGGRARRRPTTARRRARARGDALVDAGRRASTRRCRRRAWSTWSRLLGYGAPQLRAATRAPRCAARASASRSATHRRHRLVLARRREPGVARGTRPTTRCACSRPSIRSSGTAAASSCSGAGPIASRPTRRRRSASSATTRCRCSGATA